MLGKVVLPYGDNFPHIQKNLKKKFEKNEEKATDKIFKLESQKLLEEKKMIRKLNLGVQTFQEVLVYILSHTR